LAQCIAQLPEMPKKGLVLYYNEDFKLAEMATRLGLTEYEVDQLRAKTLGILQTMRQLNSSLLTLRRSTRRPNESRL
jgi:DNA-directed RNA polymerase specialized sigma subunit